VPGTARHAPVCIRPVVIRLLKVVERDANPQDALIERALVAPLSLPEHLQRLVLLEILAAVELRDPLEQKSRGLLAAYLACSLFDSDHPAWPQGRLARLTYDDRRVLVRSHVYRIAHRLPVPLDTAIREPGIAGSHSARSEMIVSARRNIR
jgi:hypothetical protein